VSASSTFYAHLFCTKVLCAAFVPADPKRICLQKAACKMLVKLTTGGDCCTARLLAVERNVLKE